MQTIKTISAYYSNSTEIMIPSLKDFIQLFDPTTRTVFVRRKRSRPDPDDFFFLPKDGVIYKVKSEKYETIQMYLDSVQAGFVSENEYKLYLESGAKSSEEFKELRVDGFLKTSSKDLFHKLKLEDLFLKMKSIVAKDIDRAINLRFNDLKTRGDLLQYASSRGIQTGEELEKYLCSDFNAFPKWKSAQECGFSSERKYDEAMKNRFSNEKDYSAAQKLGIKRDHEYQKYKQDRIDSEKKGFSIFEFSFLEGPYSQNQFHKHLKNIHDSIISIFKSRYGSAHISDEVYNIRSYSDLYKRLKEEPYYTGLIGTVDGFYNSAPSNYPTRAVIDASNVCYAEKDAAIPYAQIRAEKLLELKEILEIYGLTQLLFIADANLPHKVDGTKVLQKLKDSGLLYYTHGEQADRHLLEYTQPDTVIISNDQFRDWNLEGEYRRIGFSYDSKMGFDLL